MAFGDPGKGEFRNVIVELRNRHIAAGLSPLMTMREELTTNEDLRDRGGFDTPTRDHFLQLLGHCDKIRRHVTHNPDSASLADKIAKAINVAEEIEVGESPFGGDDIQAGSGSLYFLPWDYSGTDPNIPLADNLRLSNNGMLLLGGINLAIVSWSRLNSKDRSKFITQKDSLRVYGNYQELFATLITFGGDENRVDVAQLRATEEPRGPENAPGRKTEVTGNQAGG